MGLSVVIVAQDEERTIGRVLSAVKRIASEIILVDSGSSDNTVEIAKYAGARVIHQDWLGYAAQKNFALSLAGEDWILSLDADEIITEELAVEIEQVLAGDNSSNVDGFIIPRLLFIGEVPVKHGGFYPDAQLRLIRRGCGKFNDRLVHESIKINGPKGSLQGCILHYAYFDLSGFSEAMEKYARLSAQEYKRQGKLGWRSNILNELIHPLWTFFYRYIFRGGILDGLLGLQLALIYSGYVKKKIRYLRLGEI